MKLWQTLTAGLVGKAIERNVYNADLSMVVSKYIGETEMTIGSRNLFFSTRLLNLRDVRSTSSRVGKLTGVW